MKRPRDLKAKRLGRGAGRAWYYLFFYLPIKTTTSLMMWMIPILILGGGLFVTKLIHDKFGAFQEKLKESPAAQNAVLFAINTILRAITLVQSLLTLAVEIWDYLCPCVSLAVYIIYDILMGLLLTLFGQGRSQDNDAGDTGTVLGDTLDPSATLSSMNGFLDQLVCILLDVMSLLAGAAKVIGKAAAACLVVVFKWLSQNSRNEWFRGEYCRTKASDPSQSTTDPSNNPSQPNPENPDQKIYDGGKGPGSTCPDNHVMIQGLIRMLEMVVNILRDIFMMIFPIVAGVFKTIFDTILKILPSVFDGLSRMISMFSPDQPLGKILMFLLNFLISLITLLFRSCIIQLVISIVGCFFNVAVALVVNAVRGVIYVIMNIVCLGGLICRTNVAGDFVGFPSCDWSSVAKCSSQNYDSKNQSVSSICQFDTLTDRVDSHFSPMHLSMKRIKSSYSKEEEYHLDYYVKCVQSYSEMMSITEDTVRGHVFCRHLMRDVFTPQPLGEVELPHLINDVNQLSENLGSSCLCAYNSPICQSETCCLTFYNILVNQILSDMDMEKHTCKGWEKKIEFARIYCVSKTQRSLELGWEDLSGTLVHCDGFVDLLRETCKGAPENKTIDVGPIAGGMCNYVDTQGFCDDYRRPKRNVKHIPKMAEMYDIFHTRLGARRGRDRRGIFGGKYDRIEEPVQDSPKQRKRSSFRNPDVKLRRASYRPGNKNDVFEEARMTMQAIEDAYNVARDIHQQVHPIMNTMILPRDIEVLMGIKSKEAKLDHSKHDHFGSVRHVRVDLENSWKDYESGRLHGLKVGKPTSWSFDGNFPYTDSSTSTCSSSSGYPNGDSFQCTNDKYTQTGGASGGLIDEHVKPTGSKVQLSDIKTNSSDRVDEKTTNNPAFAPATDYVGYMYDKDMDVPSSWTPADANRNNQNPNWRIPLSPKGDLQSNTGTPAFTIYDGNSETTSGAMPKETCPLPLEFPWTRAFQKRNVFKLPMAKLFDKWPKLDASKPETFKGTSVPDNVRTTFHHMYTNKKTDYGSRFITLWGEAIEIFNHGKNASLGIYDMYSDEIKDTVKWMGISDNPQNQGKALQTNLCVNRLLSPYECCTDSATSYECCYGLFGCLPPPPKIKVVLLNNVDFIVNAQCSGSFNVISSLLLIPRLIMGKLLWKMVLTSPGWIQPTLYVLLQPVIYDKGGQGITQDVFSDAICMIVNLYWVFLILVIFMAIAILDQIFVVYVMEAKFKNRVDMIEIQVYQIQEDLDTEKFKRQAKVKSDYLAQLDRKEEEYHVSRDNQGNFTRKTENQSDETENHHLPSQSKEKSDRYITSIPQAQSQTKYMHMMNLEGVANDTRELRKRV